MLGLVFLVLLAVAFWATLKSVRVVIAPKDRLAQMSAATGTKNPTAARVVAWVSLAIFGPILLAQFSFIAVAGYQMASH